LNLSHRASHRRYGVTGHTVTDSNSNIESESVSQYAQAAQRLRGDDSGGRGLPRRQQPARGAAAPGGGARRPGFGAGCLGLKIEMQGFLLCPPLEGLPLSAFICGLYIRHNPCINYVAKSSVSNFVFLLLCRNKNLLMIGAYTNFDCRPSELQRVLASKS